MCEETIVFELISLFEPEDNVVDLRHVILIICQLAVLFILHSYSIFLTNDFFTILHRFYYRPTIHPDVV